MGASASRRFSGGSWDLRKDERRKAQEPIEFPDRRKNERRAMHFPGFEAAESQNPSQLQPLPYSSSSAFESKFIARR